MVTFVDDHHDFATVARPTGDVVHARRDWTTRISLDRTAAVSTVTVGSGDTTIAWDSLAVAHDTIIGGAIIEGIELEPTATQSDGHLAALLSRSTAVEGDTGDVVGHGHRPRDRRGPMTLALVPGPERRVRCTS